MASTNLMIRKPLPSVESIQTELGGLSIMHFEVLSDMWEDRLVYQAIFVGNQSCDYVIESYRVEEFFPLDKACFLSRVGSALNWKFDVPDDVRADYSSKLRAFESVFAGNADVVTFRANNTSYIAIHTNGYVPLVLINPSARDKERGYFRRAGNSYHIDQYYQKLGSSDESQLVIATSKEAHAKLPVEYFGEILLDSE